jgi:pimeloyl-ACP methyl ester carboxylesterase
VLLGVLIGGPLLRAAEGPKPQEIAFTAASDNTSQQYLLLLPQGFDPAEQHDLLIALHGYGSDRWQFMRPTRDETRAALDIAAKYKMIYISPDYRGTGSFMGALAEGDLSQIIEVLKKEYRIGKVILSGASMGGASSLTYAALHPELIDGLISMNGFANYLEFRGFEDSITASINASFGGTKDQVPGEYKLRSAEYWPERLTMPIAFTLSGKDDKAPPDSVLRLARILQDLHRSVLLIYRENEGHRTSYADAVAALEFAIDGAHRN